MIALTAVGIDDANEIVERIRANVVDPESAHIYEDDLRARALYTITLFSNDPFCVRIAEIALSTDEIEFPRWYA